MTRLHRPERIQSSAMPRAWVVDAQAAGGDEVLAVVTQIVADMTGYPTDLLDPELDLEADLGVDTVKQAEVFAAVREHFDVERDANLQLRDFPTLNHVAGWVRSKKGIAAPAPAAAAPVAAPAAAPAAVVSAPAAAAPSADEVLSVVTQIVADMTGYPTDLLDPELDLEADLGVDTVKQAEVFAAVREHFNVERDANLQLRDFPTLNHVAGWVRSKTGIPAPAPAAAAPAAPAAAPAAAAPAAGGADEITAVVTQIVADMTGYPTDLLDPELDLEADLGVDTVKQAEVFAAVRERFGVERDANLQLRDFPTLNHVAGWVRSKIGAAAPTGAGSAAAAAAAAPAAPAAPPVIQGDLAAIDALPRRIPVPALRPSAAQCAPTGVVLKDARVVVMLDEGGVGAALVKKLEQQGATVLTLEAGIPTQALSERLDAWLGDGPIAGVYWLPALDDEGPHEALDLAGWTEAILQSRSLAAE